jgi:nucleotide-binding universal stress UspA family protein
VLHAATLSSSISLRYVPGTIVVGVDGSAASLDALRWAAEEARIRGARLVALHAWAFVPAAPIGDPGMIAIPAGDLAGQLQAETEAARAELDESIAAALGPDPDVDVEPKLVDSDAGDALVAESEGADLVVVGSHGRSGLRAALLGSVSRHVVDHARCPVVVVKPSE